MEANAALSRVNVSGEFTDQQIEYPPQMGARSDERCEKHDQSAMSVIQDDVDDYDLYYDEDDIDFKLMDDDIARALEERDRMNSEPFLQAVRTGIVSKQPKKWNFPTREIGFVDVAQVHSLTELGAEKSRLPRHAPSLEALERDGLLPQNSVQIRTYQLDIARAALENNVLVALPTGLGKTMIAAMVMRIYYSLFAPRGQILFIAPTRPLVTQQISACHDSCGIPASHMIELTGQVDVSARKRYWAQKRVFFLTPQTLLNDLKSGNCDPLNVVLLVIDEAHKGTGDHAYTGVVKLITDVNPAFRVLALSATPGSTIGAVQAVVNALHINLIECRDERDSDVAKYIKTKTVEVHTLQLTEALLQLKNSLAAAISPLIAAAQKDGLCLGRSDPISFSSFRARAALKQGVNRLQSRSLRKLEFLSRAMGLLLDESAHASYISLTEAGGKQGGTFLADADVRGILDKFKSHGKDGLPVHPKMTALRDILTRWFESSAADDGSRTCAMVFVSHRRVVKEIVDFLKKLRPLLRPEPFVGQSTDTAGNKGLSQKKQITAIQRFKTGETNVLVCTSIGEEGLDIGEVDLVVCYDAPKAPVRVLQRVGRTGRKRHGFVHVLCSQGREEGNWDSAMESYAYIQKAILENGIILYDDVPRLIPPGVRAMFDHMNEPHTARGHQNMSSTDRSRDATSSSNLDTFFKRQCDSKRQGSPPDLDRSVGPAFCHAPDNTAKRKKISAGSHTR